MASTSTITMKETMTVTETKKETATVVRFIILNSST